jgi:aspartate/methionine/tyrosine aminotransferase
MIATQATVAFCSAAPLEVAVGNALRRGTAAGHFVDLPATLLDASLRTAMLAPRAAPKGGYFVVADASGIAEELAETVGSFDEFEREIAGGEPNYELTIALAKAKGVVGIPMAAFYSPAYRHLAGDAVRFAFAKTDAELEAAGAALSASSK